MLVKTYSAAVMGLEAITIMIEVSITRGVLLHLSGLADTSVRESYDRIRAALQNNGYKMPVADITVNMSPADIRKEGSSYDLPLAIGIMAANGQIQGERLGRFMLAGELGLDGRLIPIRGALPVAIRARKEKFEGLIVPKANEREAAVVNNLDVYGLESINDVIALLNGTKTFEPTVVDTRREFYEQQYTTDLDFADVRGQESVKRALEVAAAGGHNLIMVGPPGSGKSMMAKRLPGILPPLSLSESLETTQIYSVAGKLSSGTSLISQRPFRSPHHTISQVALVGGGSSPQPGEPSAAIRERVIAARKIQEERFKPYKGIHSNAMMTERMLHQFAEPDAQSLDMLRMAMERLKLSARAYSRILKVARTIADLAGSDRVESMHIAEAIGYRNLDRGDWAERGI